LHDGGKYWNCTGGAAGYVDRTVLTVSHMYKHGTCKVSMVLSCLANDILLLSQSRAVTAETSTNMFA